MRCVSITRDSRFPGSRCSPAARGSVLAGLIAAGLACAVTFLSSGGETLGDVSARFFHGPVLQPQDHAGEPPRAGLDVAQLVGRWIGPKGGRVIVTGKGEVWSDSGKMEGWAKDDLPAGANFGFGDGRYLCTYAVTFTGDNATDWHLISGSDGTPCPDGHFERPFSFSD